MDRYQFDINMNRDVELNAIQRCWLYAYSGKSGEIFRNYWALTLIIDKRGVNSLETEQNGCHFADNIFKCVIMSDSDCILIQISLKIVCRDPIDNIDGLVQKRRNSSALAMELCLSWINPLIYQH